jgi:hypothetical protein
MNGLEAVHIYSEDDLKQDLHLELTKKRIENEYAKAFGSDALSEVSGIEKTTSTSNLENV